jgi:hypothetical protein
MSECVVAGGASTQPRNGKGDAYRYCKRCNRGAIQQEWTRDLVLAAMLEWQHRYGRLPSSYHCSRTHAKRRGARALERPNEGEWPSASVVAALFGSWQDAREAALAEAETRLPPEADLRSSVGRSVLPINRHARAGRSGPRDLLEGHRI